MSDRAGLRAVLKRGALVAAANWPVVVIQFVAESAFKVLLAVPILGGAILVGLVLGADARDLLGDDLRSLAGSVAGALVDQPAALAAFLFAFSVVLLGGSAFMFLVKGGTVTVLALAEDRAGPIERPPLRLGVLQRAGQLTIDRFLAGCTHLFRRYLILGVALLVAYGVSGAAYLGAVLGWYRLVGEGSLLLGWTVGTALMSSVLLVWITLVNLVYLLMQMVVAVEDCGVRAASGRVAAFLSANLREVAGVFGIMLLLVVVATLLSILATAGLSLIAFVPLAGLIVFPLQAGAWILRGLLFQYLGLTALGAYLTLYRGSRHGALGIRPPEIKTA